MRTLAVAAMLVLLTVSSAWAATAAEAGLYNLNLDQGSIRDALIDLLNLAKKDYVFDSQNPGPDLPGMPGTVATMKITNAKLEDAIQALADAGNWTADIAENGRYLISWSGNPPPPSHIHVQKSADGASYVVNVDPGASQAVAVREIGQKMRVQVFLDATASDLIKQKGDALPTVEGKFSATDAEQAIRLIATPTFTVKHEGNTFIISSPDISGHCTCGQALQKNWKFCPACGKPVEGSEAPK